MAYVLPLCHVDSYFHQSLAVIILYNCTSGSRINVSPHERHEFKSPSCRQLLTPLSRLTWRDGDTPVGSWYTTPLHPSIYLSDIYIRPILLVGILIVDTRLYQSSCGSFISWSLSIYSLSASSASCDSFFHTSIKPLCRAAPDFYNLSALPGGSFVPLRPVILIIGCWL